jgi:hypothetical protein
LSSANPAAAAERPVKALSREITTGMSAPPIGSTTRLPSSPAATRMPMKVSCEGSSLPTAMLTQAATIPISSTPLITCWPGTASGLVGIRSWSLAKAMFEPQKETEPTTAAKRIGIRMSSGTEEMCPALIAAISLRISDQAIRATAPPPTPL